MGSDEPFQRYGHSKLYKTADGRDLVFGPIGCRPIQSTDPENPTIEPNEWRRPNDFCRTHTAHVHIRASTYGNARSVCTALP